MNQKLKLAELRAKTDRQLVAVIRRALDDGLASARASTPETLAQAERAYAEVIVLLPTLHNVTEADRRRLEFKLAQLRNLLGERPAPAMARAAGF